MTSSVASLLTFMLAVGLATASPGPSVAALLARVLGRGSRGMPAFCAGLIAGDLIWFGAAVFGLAVLARTAQPLFAAARYLGAAYLLWLAYKMWTGPHGTEEGEEVGPVSKRVRLFGAGLAISLGNPKTMVFYLALAPALVDLTELSRVDFFVFEGALAAVYASTLCAYVVLAARARRLVRSSRAVRRLNRATGTVMAGAAILVATRN